MNRRVNFEAANINRTVKASLKQQEEIQYIEEVLGLDQLEKALQEVATFAISGCFFRGTCSGIRTPYRKERGESSPA